MDTRRIELPINLSSAIKKYFRRAAICDILKKHGKPVARSWDAILEKNSSELDFFLDLLHGALCFSNKTIFCYDAEGMDLSELELLDVTEISSLDVLKKSSDSHVLFSKKSSEALSAYSFYVTRNAAEIHVLGKGDLSEEARQKLWTPDSVVRLTLQVKALTFDSIVVDKDSKLLFVLIDDNRYRFEESSMDMQAAFLAELQGVCPSFSKLSPIDLYPAIAEIYKNTSEGLIHRLAFECNTGAVRDEKLKVGQLDLRQESYHTAGKSAIGGEIRPFKIGVTWIPQKYDQLQCEAELEISGTRSNLQRQRGVFSALLSSTGTLNELRFSLYRLSLYVV